jgi:hypothetical protein
MAHALNDFMETRQIVKPNLFKLIKEDAFTIATGVVFDAMPRFVG